MKSDHEILQDLSRDLDRKREADGMSAIVDAPKRAAPQAGGWVVRYSEKEQAEALERMEQVERQRQISMRVNGLIGERGDRYADCTLANFAADDAKRQAAVERLRTYIDNIGQNAVDGLGVFLFGPCGTGKDHLAMAVARAFCIAAGRGVAWASGAILFEKLRDSFDGRTTEAEVLGQYARAPVFWLSDPLPVRGELTQYQAEAIYRLIDVRYNHKRPMIVTANIEPGQADATLGPAIARRLRESTIQIHCNWPSYRRP